MRTLDRALFLGLLLAAPACRQSVDVSGIYLNAVPSVAFVRTPTSLGSGVVLLDGTIVTNAHVVWPYAEALVSFASESTTTSVPVVSIDLMADLAILGPVSGRPGLTLAPDSESLPVGSPVYLVGYPGEVDEFPRPSLTAGVLSRVREGGLNDLTFLQADVTIVGGQSGGALISASGEVLGISGLAAIGERNFALVLSSQDVATRLAAMRIGKPALARTTRGTAALTHELSGRGGWAQRAFVVELEEKQRLAVTWDGAGELAVEGPAGSPVAFVDDAFEAPDTGPYFVIISAGEHGVEGTLTSDVALTELEDPDDGKQLEVGRTVDGAIDFAADTDTWVLALKKGEHVHVRIDGVLDARASVHLEADLSEELASAVGGAGGLGLSAELDFTAPSTARYVLWVDEADQDGAAGYRLALTGKPVEHPRPPTRSVFSR